VTNQGFNPVLTTPHQNGSSGTQSHGSRRVGHQTSQERSCRT